MRWFLAIFLASSGLFAAEPSKQATPSITSMEQDLIEAAIHPYLENGKYEYNIAGTSSMQHLYTDGGYEKLAASLREEAKMWETQGFIPGVVLDERPSADPAKKRDMIVFRDALEDFIRKNEVETRLNFPRPLSGHTRVVSKATLDRIFSAGYDKKPNGWQIFHKRYPSSSSIITISRPGIDSQHTTAIIYMRFQDDYLTGLGHFYLLNYNGKKWIVNDDFIFGPVWRS